MGATRLSAEWRAGHEDPRGWDGLRGLTVSRADEKGLASRAFSSGVSLGTGVTTLLFLCFILIL